MRRHWTCLLPTLLLMAIPRPVAAVQDEAVRLPGVPDLSVAPPSRIAAGATTVLSVDAESVQRSVGIGRTAALERRPARDVLAPWRTVVDKDGEYATLLTPDAVACLTGYYAGQRRWPDDKLKKELADALERFRSGVCLYVELRSFAHVSRAFGSAGKVRPGTPSEAYEALFLLDAGGERFEGITPALDSAVFGDVGINSSGLYYQRVQLPEVHHTTVVTDVHSWGQSFGANYYVWWPADELCATGQDSLCLTVITPLRQREYSVPFGVPASPRETED